MNQGGSPPQPPFVPGPFHTIRASHTEVVHLGGTFLLSLSEVRIAADQAGNVGPIKFENGRFELGPITAMYLAGNLLQALKAYAKTFGDIPREVLSPDAPKVTDIIKGLEDMLKDQRQQPPPEPPA